MTQVEDLDLDAWQRRRIWISSITFGVVTSLIKVLFFPAPQYNPPFIFVSLASFLLTWMLWRFVAQSGAVKLMRGVFIGALIGLMHPVLMWLLYALYLLLTALLLISPRAWEAFGWSLAYAYLYPFRFGWFTILIGISLGLAVALWQQHDNRGQV